MPEKRIQQIAHAIILNHLLKQNYTPCVCRFSTGTPFIEKGERLASKASR